MTKTLKQVLEGYEARSADEKRFIDKHVVVKHEDRNGNGDDVFKAKKTKYIKRKEEGHGHDAGEDHLVYEDFEDLTESLKSRFVDAISAAAGVDHYETIQNAAKKVHDNGMKMVNAKYPKGHEKHEKAKALVRAMHSHIADSKNLTDMEHRVNNLGKTMADHVKKLNEEVLGEETIGHFSNAGPFIRITKGTDKVTKKPTRHVEIHNGKAKTRLITSVDPKWDNAKIKDHLLKTHGDKLKPVTWKLNEEVLDEGQDLQYGRKPKVVTKNYSWGKMKTIHKGADFSIPMHPEHHEPISKLKDGESHHFTDETRTHWTATRSGDHVHFQSSVGKVKVPHASLNEEVLDENYTRIQNLKSQIAKYENRIKSYPGISPQKKADTIRLAKLKKEHDSLFKGQFKEETESLDEAVPSHMYHRASNGPVNPSAVAGAHHTTPEQRRAAKLKREAKEKLKEDTDIQEVSSSLIGRYLKAAKQDRYERFTKEAPKEAYTPKGKAISAKWKAANAERISAGKKKLDSRNANIKKAEARLENK